jgi:succinate dehydrogenase / fumarate reductase cytochrome b subunit
MSRAIGFYSSTLGKKIVMALSGIILFLFLAGHMAGNLQIYLGAERLNSYAELLHKNLPVLWGVRLVLLACVSVHVVAAFQVWLRNRRSRPVKYRVFRQPAVDYAARTMVWSGPIIFFFVLYHLGHLTVGCIHPQYIAGDVYSNVISGFKVPWVAGTYIIANLLVAFHLYHGLWSLFQTMGWEHPRFNRWRRIAAVVFAVVIGTGNISIPVAVLTGILGG